MLAKDRLLYPDAFKLVAILGVILAHLPPQGRFSPSAWATTETLQHATSWCVLAFFLVAGVLFRQGESRSVRAELLKRARRLLVPWVAFSVLYKVTIPALAVAGLVQRSPLPPAEIMGFLRWLSSPADPQLYFLLYLFVVQATFILLRRGGALFPVAAGFAALGVWLWNVAEGRSPSLLHGASLQLAPLYFAFFAAGTFCGASLPRVALALLVFGAAGGAVVVLLGGSWLIASQLAAPWLLVLGLQALEGRKILRPLAGLGRLSGKVYVWHAPLLISFASIVSVKLLGNGMLGVSATVAATFLAASLIGTVVNRLPGLRPFHI